MVRTYGQTKEVAEQVASEDLRNLNFNKEKKRRLTISKPTDSI